MPDSFTAKEASEYLSAKFGWPVTSLDVSTLARSDRYQIGVDRTRLPHHYSREDIENVVLSGPDSARECRKPFWYVSNKKREIYYFQEEK